MGGEERKKEIQQKNQGDKVMIIKSPEGGREIVEERENQCKTDISIGRTNMITLNAFKWYSNHHNQQIFKSSSLFTPCLKKQKALVWAHGKQTLRRHKIFAFFSS